ncbi:hypothetical protein [Thermoflexus hugenholtzii]
MSGCEEERTLEPGLAAWLERALEDESWRSGLTDAEAERLLSWAMARVGPAPERTGERVRLAMRRIGRAARAPAAEAGELLSPWGLTPPPEWEAWTPGQRLEWVLEALREWSPHPSPGKPDG